MSTFLDSHLPVRRHIGLFATTGVAALGFFYATHALSIATSAVDIYVFAGAALALALVANPVRTLFDIVGTKALSVSRRLAATDSDRGQAEEGRPPPHAKLPRTIESKSPADRGGWLIVASLALSMVVVSILVGRGREVSVAGEASAAAAAAAAKSAALQSPAEQRLQNQPAGPMKTSAQAAYEPAAAAAAAAVESAHPETPAGVSDTASAAIVASRLASVLREVALKPFAAEPRPAKVLLDTAGKAPSAPSSER
jgi:hypothetical protein